MKKLFLCALLVTITSAGTILMSAAPAHAKRWTVTQRMDKLCAEITEGRRANELTVKQVETLQKDAADIKARMEKMKAKNGGKLSVPDTKKLHDDMTELSVKTLRMRLNNVYSD